MGNSATKLQTCYDQIRAEGIDIPTDRPGGYGTLLAIEWGNDVMAEIVAERFNWKWNRSIASPFLTNSYQQDYPQIGLTSVGWLEEADRLDVNNTSNPQPLNTPGGITVVRQISRTSLALWPINKLCWMYNYELSYGTWPGPGVTFYPLITSLVKQNPIMSMIDVNGNRMILTTFGTTGSSAPSAAANAAEGTLVPDGTAEWTVVSPNSQGFRVGNSLPGATGPVYEITAYYQNILQKMSSLGSLINPIPDEYSYLFKDGLKNRCKRGSTDPNRRAEGMKEYPLWIEAMAKMRGQANREPDDYVALPSSSPVESVYGPWGRRNPQDPSQPY